VFVPWIRQRFGKRLKNVVIVGPDAGAEKRVMKIASILGCERSFLTKSRAGRGDVEMDALHGANVDGKICILNDDMIDTGGTIIKAGKALQMTIPIYGGHNPLNLNRVTEAQQQFSETGQWLGRIIKRRAVVSTYEWDYLTPSWYAEYFEPFAQTLPLQPFCIAGNPSKITSDVGFVWTDSDARPTNMGVQAFMSVSLGVTGYY
jgi:hypothetical protein